MWRGEGTGECEAWLPTRLRRRRWSEARSRGRGKGTRARAYWTRRFLSLSPSLGAGITHLPSSPPLLSFPMPGNVVSVKLTSRDPSPPPFEYVRGGGGIFKVRGGLFERPVDRHSRKPKLTPLLLHRTWRCTTLTCLAS